MKIIVTGGAGFIGSALVRQLVSDQNHHVLNIDNLSYSANMAVLDEFSAYKNYSFVQADIADEGRMREIFRDFKPDAVMNLAAESHVDRSIDGPAPFIKTNILGTFALLQVALEHYKKSGAGHFRFHHISTDEVYGSLGPSGYFLETTPYNPSSPYSASKASSDHLVRAWHNTYGLPVLVTNCSNNYGAYQFPEKLIPLMIIKALQEKPMPVYGDGSNVRDWLFVEDHAEALVLVLKKGRIGETYNIGGKSERSNLQIVKMIVKILDDLVPSQNLKSREQLITFVADRPGHDFRYAINCSKIEKELGWKPSLSFEQGLEKTIRWYLDNHAWWQGILDHTYDGKRIGAG